MTDHLDNPAGRLLVLLRDARAVTQGGGIGSSLALWSRVFDIPLGTPKGEYEIIHRLLETTLLVDDLESQIRSIEDEEERGEFLVPLPRIRVAFPVAAASNTAPNVVLQITDGDLIVLNFCSRYLHNHRPEPVADSAELEKLSDELANLFTKVNASSSLEKELKEFLLTQIEAVRRGIQEYRIGGIERLRETLGIVLGASLINESMVREAKETDEMKEFAQAVNHLASIIEFAWKTTKVLQATQPLMQMLLG